MKTWNIVKKDVVILLSDRKALAVLILMPVILMTILGAGLSSSFDTGTMAQQFKIGIVREYAVQGIDEIIEDLPFSDQMDIDPETVDLDIEKILFEEVLDSEEIQEIFTYEFYTLEEGIQAVEGGEISNLVIFPEDFLKNTYINLITPFRNEVTLEVLVNPDRYIDTQITQAVFGGFEGYLNQMVAVKNVYTDLVLKSGMGYAALEKLETIYQSLESAGDQNTSVTYENIEARRSIDSVEYYAMAMLSMFILFTGGQGGRMMLEEKDQYTFQRMRLSGISKWQIFLGKFVTVFIVGIVQVSIMVIYTSVILKVDWGNYFNLVLVSICALLAVASMGTLISVITLRVGNYKIANVMESFIFQVMAFLGGSFMPLEVLPKAFEKISYLTINGLALKGYLYNMQGYGLEEIGIFMMILLGIAGLFTGVGLLLMRDEKRWKRAEYHQTQNA